MAVGTPAAPVRLGGGGGNVKAKATKVAAWASFGLAVAASPLLAGTFVGGIVDNLLGILPAFVPLVVFVVMIVSTAVDLGVDGVPNRVALYCAMLACSVARSVQGRLGDSVERWANALLDQIRGPLGDLLGTGSALTLALAAAAAAPQAAARGPPATWSGGPSCRPSPPSAAHTHRPGRRGHA